jgi:hypothetical protein
MAGRSSATCLNKKAAWFRTLKEAGEELALMGCSQITSTSDDENFLYFLRT